MAKDTKDMGKDVKVGFSDNDLGWIDDLVERRIRLEPRHPRQWTRTDIVREATMIGLLHMRIQQGFGPTHEDGDERLRRLSVLDHAVRVAYIDAKDAAGPDDTLWINCNATFPEYRSWYFARKPLD